MRYLMILALLPGLAAAEVRVVTTLPHLASMTRAIGGEKVSVISLTSGRSDPHYITPTPSLMSKVRKADLFIEIGLGLEIWTERVIDGSRNPKVRPKESGHAYASRGVIPLDIPSVISRSQGDLHPRGNPHIWLDPLRAKTMATNIAAALKRIDPDNAKHYAVRLKAFHKRIDEAMFGKQMVALFGGDVLSGMAEKGRLIPFLKSKRLGGKPLIDKLGGWVKKALPLRGRKVVYYHKTWVYLSARFGLKIAGYIEEKPGIPPSAAHRDRLVKLIKANSVGVVGVASFYSEKTAKKVVAGTTAKVVVLPIDVGGTAAAKDYFSLMDTILDGHLKAFGK